MQPGDLVGQIIDGKYQVECLIGFGGMGSVYRCRQLDLNRTVAIKLLLPELFSNQESIGRFEREAQILSRFRHPNVVQFFSWGHWNSHPYLVMEYLDGKPLRKWIDDEKKFEWVVATQLGAQVCKALAAIHGEGIVHRDLTPNNIFVFGELQSIKIIDFGLARSASNDAKTLTETGALVGSIHYLSPEVCSGNRAVVQSDIYSLGCILYEMIAGKKPFECDNPVGLIFKHANEYPPPLRSITDVPVVIENIVFKSMCKSTEDRYPSAEEMGKQLEAVSQGRLAEIPIEGWPLQPPGKQTRTPRAVIALISSLLLIALVAYAYRSANTTSEAFHKKPRQLSYDSNSEVRYRLRQVKELERAGETDSTNLAHSLSELAFAYIHKAQFHDARSCLDRAERILQGKSGIEDSCARSLMLLRYATLMQATNQDVEAEKYASTCLAECQRRHEFSHHEVDALRLLSELKEKQERPREALEYIERAIAAQIKSNDPTIKASNVHFDQARRAQFLSKLGNFAESEKAAKAVLNEMPKCEAAEADARELLIRVILHSELQRGCYTSARRLVEQSKQHFSQSETATLIEKLASIVEARGKEPELEKLLTQLKESKQLDANNRRGGRTYPCALRYGAWKCLKKRISSQICIIHSPTRPRSRES